MRHFTDLEKKIMNCQHGIFDFSLGWDPIYCILHGATRAILDEDRQRVLILVNNLSLTFDTLVNDVRKDYIDDLSIVRHSDRITVISHETRSTITILKWEPYMCGRQRYHKIWVNCPIDGRALDEIIAPLGNSICVIRSQVD